MEKHPWKGLKPISLSLSNWGFNPVRMEKHPWKGLKLFWSRKRIPPSQMSEWKNIPGRVWNLATSVTKPLGLLSQNGKTSLEGFETVDQTAGMFLTKFVRMEKHPWKGLKLLSLYLTSFDSLLPSEWKNIPGRVWNIYWMINHQKLSQGQNGKTSLEGFETRSFFNALTCPNWSGQNGKTSLEGFETFSFSFFFLRKTSVRMEKHPWKGLKRSTRIWITTW